MGCEDVVGGVFLVFVVLDLEVGDTEVEVVVLQGLEVEAVLDEQVGFWRGCRGAGCSRRFEVVVLGWLDGDGVVSCGRWELGERSCVDS